MEPKLPVLSPRPVLHVRPNTAIAALFQPKTLATVPFTPPSPFGQLQVRFEVSCHWQLDPAAQLTEPEIAPELQPWLRLAENVGEWVAEHSLQTIGILAGATLVFALAASRN